MASDDVSCVMTKRLLLVEPSATMRYVLDKHAQSLGFEVAATESFGVAAESLEKQYQQFGTEFCGVLFGWPITEQDDATALAQLLEQPSYRDLPVVVMSTDMRATTRAWVAGRENSGLLAWKEYQGLEAELQKLIEADADDTAALPSSDDNSDIHLLIVDDSATIRYSLRDLFQLQGYRVSLAATQVEAMQVATTDRVDIAILDYYLTETTGDLLCRDLMMHTAVGNIVCTVLTGTYSDHIIKRSLRAGAVECMFKNESSELLLSRIAALSRFVRQRRRLQHEHHLLEDVIEAVAGAVLILDAERQISYINDAGLQELQLERRESLVGQPGSALLEKGGPQSGAAGQPLSASWRLPDGKQVDVDYEHVLVESAGHSLIRFARATIPVVTGLASGKAASSVSTAAMGQTAAANTTSDSPAGNSAERVAAGSTGRSPDPVVAARPQKILPTSGSFMQQMRWYLSKGDTLAERTSLMVMDVQVVDEQGQLRPLNEFADLHARVETVMQGIYKRPGHVTLLTDTRFGFLLRHREESHVYLLARKIMQLCLELQLQRSDVSLNCAGSLLSLVDKQGHSLETLLLHAFKGVELARARGDNQILLMDLRRMLNAYPAPDSGAVR